MRRPDPELLRFAEQILIRESKAGHEELTPVETACNALQKYLDRVIGLRGFHAIVTRAIFLARTDYPWLSTLNVSGTEGCALTGAAEAARAGGTDATAGFAAFIANAISLLATFVGEKLALRFISEAWPGVPIPENLLPEGTMYE